MARVGAGNVIIMIILLIGGMIAAFILWVLLFLPLQLVKPLPFLPLSITEGDRDRTRLSPDREKGGNVRSPEEA